MLKGPADTASRRLMSVFKQFGKVLGVTTRKKPGNKSWALVTFQHEVSAVDALDNEVQVTAGLQHCCI